MCRNVSQGADGAKKKILIQAIINSLEIYQIPYQIHLQSSSKKWGQIMDILSFYLWYSLEPQLTTKKHRYNNSSWMSQDSNG